MKIKTITFEEYSICKEQNEGRSYSEIFDIAWKQTKECKNQRANQKKVIKILGLASCGVIFTWFSMIFSPSIIVHADVLGMEKLVVECPGLFTKLQSIKELYLEYLSLSGMKDNYHVFMDMICLLLDKAEFLKFIKASDGLEIEEIIRFIACL